MNLDNIKNKILNLKKVGKNNQNFENKPKNYYQDLINPYQLIFHPSFLEINEKLLKEYLILNDMSGEKNLNYLNPLFRYPKKSDISLHFSPIDGVEILKKYKKALSNLQSSYQKDIELGKEPDKKMEKMIRDYRIQIEDIEEERDSFLNYGIIYSQDLERTSNKDDDYGTFLENRTNLLRFFSNNLQQPSKFYLPLGQVEEAFLSNQPLAEYRIKDWSNISAVDGMSLYPFFTETKDPGAEDGVPYGINRNTGEMFFFNHSKLYKDGYITNRNMNVYGGTGSGKTSFFRSQIPLRMSYGDHFILFDPKKDYVAFTKDLGGQNISFNIDKPIGYNFFFRSDETYTKKENINGELKEIEVEIQSIEDKKQNLMKIFSIMCPYLNQKGVEDASVSEFSIAILDHALSKLYTIDTNGKSASLQSFYDFYLKDSINYFAENEPEKMNGYTVAGERLKSNFGLFVKKEDGTEGMYYKMFLPVPEGEEIKLQDGPLINFDLSGIFRNDLLFTIGCLIGMEFTWTQIAKRKWIDKTAYIVIDENWKLLKYDKAGEYEEQFSRLIRGLGGGLITMSQHLNEYVNSEYGEQVLAQAQTSIILKIEPNELEHLKKRFPKWFTEEVIQDFEEINKNRNSYGIGYIVYRGRMQPFKYLYLPNVNGRNSWQEKASWQHNMDSDEGFEN